MDGVLVHEEKALPGAAEFLDRLVEKQRRFLVLTNNSIFTPRDLAARLIRSGPAGARGVDLDVGPGDGGLPAGTSCPAVRPTSSARPA